MLFDKNRNRSLKHQIKYFIFRGKIQLDHSLENQRNGSNSENYLSDVVDDWAEEGEAGRDDLLVVLHDELDGVLLQLREEHLRRVPDQRHRQLQGQRHVADDLQSEGTV